MFQTWFSSSKTHIYTVFLTSTSRILFYLITLVKILGIISDCFFLFSASNPLGCLIAFSLKDIQNQTTTISYKVTTVLFLFLLVYMKFYFKMLKMYFTLIPGYSCLTEMVENRTLGRIKIESYTIFLILSSLSIASKFLLY